ncbi:MAG: alanine racemase [Candidatus Sungbacteria bacterium]|uniref:Alanine racemase n=1 Tax=Candidatus Sungiibacteriota bacterium TaxID=2750080 RepID=A0A931WPN2_9BACT|nr:alanine racemase [Candidatus Sungbacteria bacterium]
MTPLLRTHRTWIEIDRRALLANLRYFARRAQGASMMVMIKSNAYGHGLVTIAKLLARQNLYLGVDSITEALRLRKENIQNPILVLGYTLPTRMREAAAKNIVVTISHFEGLASLAKLKKRPRFHVKIDTGMHRQGFQESQVPRLIAALKQYRLRPDGLYSHLAMASHSAFSRKQILAFERCLELFQKADLGPRLVHFNKTEGIVNFPQASHSLVRLGIGLYGYYPAPGVRLRPVLAWKTIVGEVKTIKKGERVSYDLTERVRRDTKIAILPVGYWHGFDRGLSCAGTRYHGYDHGGCGPYQKCPRRG